MFKSSEHLRLWSAAYDWWPGVHMGKWTTATEQLRLLGMSNQDAERSSRLRLPAVRLANFTFKGDVGNDMAIGLHDPRIG